jgi:hypothetical protein
LWDTSGADSCPTCGTTLNPELVQIEEAQQREVLRLSKPPSSLDKFFTRWRTSPNIFLRFTFMAAYGAWLVYAAILAFFLWLIAAMPG